LQQVLQQLVISNANSSYHPEKHKDLDLAEFTRQTLAFKGLWEIHSNLPPPSVDSINDRVARNQLRAAISQLQQILFPWITDRREDQQGTESLFSLVESYREEAGIVITTGTKGFRWTMHQVSTLRNVLNCSLPIEM
jgi:hypothetical protein